MILSCIQSELYLTHVNSNRIHRVKGEITHKCSPKDTKFFGKTKIKRMRDDGDLLLIGKTQIDLYIVHAKFVVFMTFKTLFVLVLIQKKDLI